MLENRNSNSKEFNNTAEKRPSFLLLNKNNNTQSRTHLNDVNLLGLLNIKQLKRKYTVIGGKINTFGLDYHNLDQVHKGDEASSSYLSLKDLNKEEEKELRYNMLKYCKLDTYAMVKIYDKLLEVVNE